MRQFELSSSFFSMDVTIKRIKATEEEIKDIFDAAFRGLEGDALALVAGFDPTQFQVLCQSDEIAARAVRYGKAMCEARLSGAALDKALIDGDVKAIMFLLTHKHNWKQAKPEGESSNEIRIIVENAEPQIIPDENG
jgi:hypothetical protein